MNERPYAANEFVSSNSNSVTATERQKNT
jgi:hypothetical protein